MFAPHIHIHIHKWMIPRTFQKNARLRRPFLLYDLVVNFALFLSKSLIVIIISANFYSDKNSSGVHAKI